MARTSVGMGMRKGETLRGSLGGPPGAERIGDLRLCHQALWGQSS